MSQRGIQRHPQVGAFDCRRIHLSVVILFGFAPCPDNRVVENARIGCFQPLDSTANSLMRLPIGSQITVNTVANEFC